MFTISTYGEDLVAAELDAMGARANDLTPVWPRISREMEQIVVQQYETEGARGGDPWDDLAISTIYRKFRQGRNLNILREFDDMFQSLTEETGDSVREETTDSFEFGSTLKQFAIHQDWQPGNKFPERKPVVFTEVDERKFTGFIEGWIVGDFNRAGQRVSRGRFASGPGAFA